MKYFALLKIPNHESRLFSLAILSEEEDEVVLSEYDRLRKKWSDSEALRAEIEQQKDRLIERDLQWEMVFEKCKEEVRHMFHNLQAFAEQGNFDALLQNFHDGKRLKAKKSGMHGPSGREFLSKIKSHSVQEYKTQFKGHELVEFQWSYVRLYGLRYSHDLLVIIGGCIKLEPTMQDSEELLKIKKEMERRCAIISEIGEIPQTLRRGEDYHHLD